MKRSTLLLLIALLATTGLTACNTVKGFGQDLQKVGENMEEKADK
jgi:predicted small secreted protein